MKNATDAQKKTWTTSCNTAAKEAFVALGGSEKEWDVARRDGAKDQGIDQMRACFNKLANGTMAAATDAQKKTWQSACNVEAKEVFEASGGSAQEWAQMKEKGARDEV